jgi:hypothetical protein
MYSFDMVIGLDGYTTVTFDAAAQVAFVAGIAVLGEFDANTVELLAVTDNIPSYRRSLLQTVSGWELVAYPGGMMQHPLFLEIHLPIDC